MREKTKQQRELTENARKRARVGGRVKEGAGKCERVRPREESGTGKG